MHENQLLILQLDVPLFAYCVFVLRNLHVHNHIFKLEGTYSERVQLPAKAKFGGFVDNTWQHLPHLLLLEV